MLACRPITRAHAPLIMIHRDEVYWQEDVLRHMTAAWPLAKARPPVQDLPSRHWVDYASNAAGMCAGRTNGGVR